jgi:ribonucleoside-diphosphate reductase beta chain
MSSLLGERDYYKPFEYPWAFTAYEMQNQMHWVANNIPLHEDMREFKAFKESDKNVVTHLFRFFTQGDVDIGKAYNDVYMPVFKKPELRMMMNAFANAEAVHVHAYSMLLDSLGLPEVEYRAFKEYEEMAAKHDYLKNFNSSSVQEIAKSLAVFSAFVEGMQLFSSFAILLHFTRGGKMKGMGQIITYSIKDESLHCQSMMKLFNALIKENPQIWTEEFKEVLYKICFHMVELEDKFIDLAFELGDIDNLKKDDIKQFYRFIANIRLTWLGLEKKFDVPTNPLPWMEEMLGSLEHMNFFENRATEYSKGALSGNWGDVWGKAPKKLVEV